MPWSDIDRKEIDPVQYVVALDFFFSVSPVVGLPPKTHPTKYRNRVTFRVCRIILIRGMSLFLFRQRSKFFLLARRISITWDIRSRIRTQHIHFTASSIQFAISFQSTLSQHYPSRPKRRVKERENDSKRER